MQAQVNNKYILATYFVFPVLTFTFHLGRIVDELLPPATTNNLPAYFMFGILEIVFEVERWRAETPLQGLQPASRSCERVSV